MRWYCRTCKKRKYEYEADKCIRAGHNINPTTPMSEWAKERAKQFRETHTWPRGTRAKLQRRDGNGCAMCTSMILLSIHHDEDSGVDSYRNPDGSPKYDLRYLVALCGSCHGKVHKAPSNCPFMRAYKGIMERARDFDYSSNSLKARRK